MSVRIGSLRVGRRDDSAVVPDASPTLSWTTETDREGWIQASAELELDGIVNVVVNGRDSVLVAWPFAPLLPRDRHRLRVRVTGEDGSVSAWSEPVEFWAGFLADGEWTASLIGGRGSTAGSALMLRTEFETDRAVSRATLYATAHGVYDVFVNGEDVDAEVLKPGWTPYKARLVHESTDITGLIRPGANAVGVLVGDGWYAERVFAEAGSHLYGDRLGAAVQIVIEYADGECAVVVSDESWRVSDAGPVRSSSIYDGERYDARRECEGWADAGFDDTAWSPVALLELDVVPTARTSPAVRLFEEVPPRARLASASGGEILDFGQNIVGRLRIRVSGDPGTVVRLEHAEVLEHGELGRRPLRSAQAADEYVLHGGGVEEWEPRFTFHGFRYAQLTTSADLSIPAEATAVVIHSDLRRTGTFRCSHELLDRLHENVVWGMRGNFLALPTDCPQRDERLGWTGDIQVFAPTASFLYDVDAFLGSWLEDLAHEQAALGDGSVPFVVPNVLWDALTPAAAWGDAATVVPHVLMERYGDSATLRRQFDSMRGWADRLLGIAGERMLWEGGFQFGDWLDPAAPPDDPFRARTDRDIVATAYMYRSLQLVAVTAELLQDVSAAHYAERADAVKAAFLAEYVTVGGRLASDTETAYALAVQFGLHRSAEERQRMGDRLAEAVRRDGFRIATGFVGTPLVIDGLTATGHHRVAERLLLQTENPSWLYPVTMGATTIWERWDSMLEDGTINPGEMTSFNHYALGAVADWMHREIGGIAPAEPGYRRVRVAPRPLEALSFATAELDSPYGPIRVDWRREEDAVRYDVQIPPNATADVLLPGQDAVVVGSGRHVWTVLGEAAPTPRLTMQASTAAIRDDPSAYGRVNDAIATVHAEYARRFRERTRWAADLTLEQALRAYPVQVGRAVAAALEAD